MRTCQNCGESTLIRKSIQRAASKCPPNAFISSADSPWHIRRFRPGLGGRQGIGHFCCLPFILSVLAGCFSKCALIWFHSHCHPLWVCRRFHDRTRVKSSYQCTRASVALHNLFNGTSLVGAGTQHSRLVHSLSTLEVSLAYWASSSNPFN